jgi:hypothetical protein
MSHARVREYTTFYNRCREHPSANPSPHYPLLADKVPGGIGYKAAEVVQQRAVTPALLEAENRHHRHDGLAVSYCVLAVR